MRNGIKEVFGIALFKESSIASQTSLNISNYSDKSDSAKKEDYIKEEVNKGCSQDHPLDKTDPYRGINSEKLFDYPTWIKIKGTFLPNKCLERENRGNEGIERGPFGGMRGYPSVCGLEGYCVSEHKSDQYGHPSRGASPVCRRFPGYPRGSIRVHPPHGWMQPETSSGR
ncbi:hypothetical protein AVEN_177869-1 [Araneus ventricosus]|uniref:Uncharacterized protein n=1 Tax=Araneus ventricosus TaxID=182803 RepID=A0A4Y2UXA5_ARAVE|nr:hypothetical protein AVEN_262714-1 [Araneus ventricosus]GBO16386.1 hypothetical protein AVEN_203520-1 [Araneus ventricosus]GBO16443.1 hypothetical protein AVEN_69085-1 [Araneus ventricosus]GBO16453.1 hypothetical protein AVEN_177869-1 [Araneus ventricosus]